MPNLLERPSRTTAPAPSPTRGSKRSPDRSGRWLLWAVLAAGTALLAIAIGIGLTIGSDGGEPVADVAADTYVLDGTRLLPGHADGWFRPPEGPGPQVLGNAIERSSPVRQGYEAGLPDGWYDPAADTAAPSYPRGHVR